MSVLAISTAHFPHRRIRVTSLTLVVGVVTSLKANANSST